MKKRTTFTRKTTFGREPVPPAPDLTVPTDIDEYMRIMESIEHQIAYVSDGTDVEVTSISISPSIYQRIRAVVGDQFYLFDIPLYVREHLENGQFSFAGIENRHA